MKRKKNGLVQSTRGTTSNKASVVKENHKAIDTKKDLSAGVSNSNRPIPMIYSGGGPEEGDANESSSSRLLLPLSIKADHSTRPLWVCSDGMIYFEASKFPALFTPVCEFLVAIAEPVCRPKDVHQYQITVCSLYAAISLGMDSDEILANLRKLSKNEIDNTLSDYISLHGSRIGKVRLVLGRGGRYFVESSDLGLLKLLESLSEKIRNAKLNPTASSPDGKTFRFEVDCSSIEQVKESAYHDAQIPLLEEFEFKDDAVSSSGTIAAGNPASSTPEGHQAPTAQQQQLSEPTLSISIRPSTQIRPYQEGSLHKMFSGNRARSGMIVLPCGAGKTLVGILAASTLKRRTMILTTTAVAVDQWKRQFEYFCFIDPESVLVLTADSKQQLPDEDKACVLISTYSMFSVSYERMSRSSRAVIDQVRSLEWGLLIVDEVQVMPAKTFRTVATTVRAHCKLGLTATLVREDDLIEDLQYLIGPKLYEANWQELQELGYIARVQCIELWSSMPDSFWNAFLNCPSYHVRRAMYTCNPNKLAACEYLVKLHEARNDKIIIFCDNVTLLQHMAKTMRKPFICGSVTMQERMACIRAFQHSNKINTIFLSQVGDNAIDIPNANVVVQISSHYGSRRQEAQRLGRILRPKSYRDSQGFNAYFYSLISTDTPEKLFAERRQTFLVDQGYAFTVIADFDAKVKAKSDEGERFFYLQDDLQKFLLRKCLEGSSEVEQEEDVVIVDSSCDISAEYEKNFISKYESTSINIADLTGGDTQGGYYYS